jgi:CRISPR-associated protein Cmr5
VKIRTRDQARAQHAYTCVSEVAGTEDFASYGSLVNGFGATVMRNGLVAALAFVQRRSDAAARTFLVHLCRGNIPGMTGKPDLLQVAIALDVDQYLVATREVLALAVWFRRAVQAREASVTPGPSGQEAGGHA